MISDKMTEILVDFAGGFVTKALMLVVIGIMGMVWAFSLL